LNADEEELYAGHLTPEDREQYERARRVEGLDQEIALLRMTIAKHVADEALLLKGVDLLIKGVKAKHGIAEKGEDDWQQRVGEVMRGFGQQLMLETSEPQIDAD